MMALMQNVVVNQRNKRSNLMSILFSAYFVLFCTIIDSYLKILLNCMKAFCKISRLYNEKRKISLPRLPLGSCRISSQNLIVHKLFINCFFYSLQGVELIKLNACSINVAGVNISTCDHLSV